MHRSNLNTNQPENLTEDGQNKQVDKTTRDGEHHLQTQSYKRDETSSEYEVGKEVIKELRVKFNEEARLHELSMNQYREAMNKAID